MINVSDKSVAPEILSGLWCRSVAVLIASRSSEAYLGHGLAVEAYNDSTNVLIAMLDVKVNLIHSIC